MLTSLHAGIRCDLEFCWNCLGDFQHLATQGACIPPPVARADSLSDEIKYRQTERAARKEARKVEDDMSEAIIIVTTKNCPRCKYAIEKDGGCDHMTCSNCLTQFCYECLNNYATINAKVTKRLRTAMQHCKQSLDDKGESQN